MRKMPLDKAIEKAMSYCSKMERCRYDLQQKFYKWGLNEADTEKVFAKLNEGKFIDEERYVESYVRGKFIYSKWGKVKIKYNLMLKGIEEALIDKHIDTIDQEEYEALINEQIRKKNFSLTIDDSYQRKSKLIRFAQGRGYETEIALACVDKMVEDNFEMEE